MPPLGAVRSATSRALDLSEPGLLDALEHWAFVSSADEGARDLRGYAPVLTRRPGNRRPRGSEMGRSRLDFGVLLPRLFGSEGRM